MAAPAFEHPALNAHALPTASPVTQALLSAAVTLAKWETRARTRAALRELPAERLPDIGLTTAEALHEGAKPFWRA
ncbi:DUF1127 domain-containing protein [Jannaschia aquimarina]|uniref:YjiS-like domain-containing protein n=1 Tax=Jannaschia aquimarina TaxID=935700 RepID=A0A0D1CIV9_9RHOB|nr:DUF1127 domain-containing protein [Jannaschia aquimarina]KIT14657.1 hypothetical protein jaqu_35990 [Jannaschia aquimarina]SNT37747.1 Uncharacterized conserved protein YjiS, DUF1127 family [Jannaschia aquimarina]